jgi:hypothetical protein
MFVKLTCINGTPVNSEHKSWSQGVRFRQNSLSLVCNFCEFNAFNGVE